MNATRRKQEILRLLGGHEELSAGELAQQFGVNVVTIRRDLIALADAGLLVRTHGGAVPADAGRAQFAFDRQRQTHRVEKAAIAMGVARLIRPGMCVSLDTGTTTLQVARRLATISPLKVLTSSLAIAAELHGRPQIELILLGGIARKGSPDLFGSLTEDNLARFRVDVAIIGADAVGPDGLFTTDANVARVTAAMLAGARTAVLAVDSSKFSASAFVRFAQWKDIDEVVTDARLSRADRRWLHRVVHVTCVAVRKSRQLKSSVRAPLPLGEGGPKGRVRV